MKKNILLLIITMVTTQAFAARVVIHNKSGRDIQARYYKYPSYGEKYGEWKSIKNGSDESLINTLDIIDGIYIKDQGKESFYDVNSGPWTTRSYTYQGPKKFIKN